MMVGTSSNGFTVDLPLGADLCSSIKNLKIHRVSMNIVHMAAKPTARRSILTYSVCRHQTTRGGRHDLGLDCAVACTSSVPGAVFDRTPPVKCVHEVDGCVDDAKVGYDGQSQVPVPCLCRWLYSQHTAARLNMDIHSTLSPMLHYARTVVVYRTCAYRYS